MPITRPIPALSARAHERGRWSRSGLVLGLALIAGTPTFAPTFARALAQPPAILTLPSAPSPTTSSTEPGEGLPDEPVSERVVNARATMLSRDATDAQVLLAIDDLLALATDATSSELEASEACQVVTETLKRGVGDAICRAILRSIAARAVVCDELRPTLQSLLESPAVADRVMVLGSLGSIRTQESAALLVNAVRKPKSPEERDAAFSALARLSGRDDLPRESEAWAKWLEESLALSPMEWEVRLGASLASALDRANWDRAALAGRLVASYRRLHVLTPPEQRAAFITPLLSDGIPEVVLLGLELVSRELSAGNAADPATIDAVLALLSHPRAIVRQNAATLAGTIAPASGEAVMVAALEREHHPAAARALLAACERWRSEKVEAAVVRWLAVEPASAGLIPPATRDAAIATGWSLYRAGFLRAPERAEPVLAALREIPVTSLTGAGVRLRAALGTETDLETLALALGSKESSQRVAAAESLVPYPEFMPRVLAAAREDPQLLEAALRCVITQDPTVSGFRAILSVTERTLETRRASLMAVAAVMPAEDVLAAADLVREDSTLREAVLSVLADENRILSTRANSERMSALARGVVELVKSRLSLGRPAEALAALDVLPDLGTLTDAATVRDLRATAMLMLERSDSGEAINASFEAWMDALRFTMDRAQWARLYEEAAARFGPESGPMNKLEELAAQREAQVMEAFGEPTTVPGGAER